jgi:hypothetical protein
MKIKILSIFLIMCANIEIICVKKNKEKIENKKKFKYSFYIKNPTYKNGFNTPEKKDKNYNPNSPSNFQYVKTYKVQQYVQSDGKHNKFINFNNLKENKQPEGDTKNNCKELFKDLPKRKLFELFTDNKNVLYNSNYNLLFKPENPPKN